MTHQCNCASGTLLAVAVYAGSSLVGGYAACDGPPQLVERTVQVPAALVEIASC